MYKFYRNDGKDLISDTNGNNVLEIRERKSWGLVTGNPFSFDSIDDLKFSGKDSNLTIDLLPDIWSDGQIVIANQSFLNSRVETLQLFDDNGKQFDRISLVSVWNVVSNSSTPVKIKLVDGSYDNHGQLVAAA